MSKHFFDDSNIHWQTLADFDHLWFSVLDIDDTNRTIDVLFKFAANRKIVLHRHCAVNKTFVVQGEHRIYNADDTVKEVRAVGSYTSSQPSDQPHREGGGEIDAVVLFSIRGNGVLYEILDDNLEKIGELDWQSFVDLHAARPRT